MFVFYVVVKHFPKRKKDTRILVIILVRDTSTLKCPDRDPALRNRGVYFLYTVLTGCFPIAAKGWLAIMLTLSFDLLSGIFTDNCFCPVGRRDSGPARLGQS